MASRKAHIATGWAAGVIAAVVVIHAGAAGPYAGWALLALIAGVSGGTAPDWLEIAFWSPRRRLWIAHRTLTHVGVLWLALLYYAYKAVAQHHWASIPLGFAAGGVMHLLCDWPNPLGVPWLFKRNSLHLWASGDFDFIVVGVAWLAALLTSDWMLFKGVHCLKVLAYIRTMPLFS